MAFHVVRTTSDMQLAHLVERDRDSFLGGSITTTKYAIRPLGVSRPADGQLRHKVQCPECRRFVEVLVPSARLTVRMQQRWLTAALVLIAVALATLGYLIVRSPTDELQIGVALLILIVTLLVGLGCLSPARHTHGVRVAPQQPGGERHSIRLPQQRARR